MPDRTPKPQPDVEEVAASEIEVNDQIFFPNSRKAQPVTEVRTSDVGVHLSLLGAQWSMKSDNLVRRVKATTEGEE